MLGRTRPITIESHIALAIAYQDTGDYEKSFQITQSCVKALKKTNQINDLETQRVNVRLGCILHCMGDYQESERLLRSTFDVFVTVLGPESKQGPVPTCRDNLSLGWYKECRRFDKGLWKTQKRVLGEAHPETTRTLLRIAEIQKSTGEYESALALIRRSTKE